MSLSFATATASTKGKSPQLFEFPAVGELAERIIKSKSGDRIVSAIDCTEAAKVTTLPDVLEWFNQNPVKDLSANQALIYSALMFVNTFNRKANSPVAEAPDDELAPIVAILVSSGHLDAENERAYRMGTTSGARATGFTRLEFAAMTKEVKAAIAAGVDFGDTLTEVSDD